MKPEELKEVLRLHKLWLEGNPEGKCADFSGANLAYANLSHVNLTDANLAYANLSHVNLTGADLAYADLSYAILRGANLSRVNLTGANLRDAILSRVNLTDANLTDANLTDANLRDANLTDANLTRANLTGANLTDANLTNADLSYANLTGANLRDAILSRVNLRDAKLPNFQICPEVGSFRAFKKLANGDIVELEIPARAKRTSSLVGRKCRAEFAKVITFWNTDHSKSKSIIGKSTYINSFKYVKGSVVHSYSYDDDIRIECTHGIHFFVTFKEAAEYC